MEIDPPAPPGRRKSLQYTKSPVVGDPAGPSGCDPRHNRRWHYTHRMTSPFRATLAALLVAGLCACSGARPPSARCDTGPWMVLLRAHLARYPEMQPADAYKLLHQATLGSEHAMPSRAMAAEWLTREIATLPPGPADPLVDTLGAGARFARINLRPFLAAGGVPDSLLNAFVRTAQEAVRDTAQLTCALGAVRQMTMAHETSWATDSVDRLFEEARAAGYPAMHHSDRFEAAYHPAYRVVSVTLVSAALP